MLVFYASPKLVFTLLFLLFLLLTTTKTSRRKVAAGWLLGLFSLVEVGLAGWQTRRRYLEGTPLARATRAEALRLSLNLTVLSLQAALWVWLRWPFALLLNCLVGLVGLGATVLLNLRLLLRGMKAVPASATEELFQQVRQMQDLEEAATQLRTRLALVKERVARFDLRFYLGWAETYQGHQALAQHDWHAAQRYYEVALTVDPTNPAARAALVLSLAQQHNYEAATSQYAQATRQVRGELTAHTEPILWSRHVNESSSEYEINAGLFQLGVWLYAALDPSPRNDNTTRPDAPAQTALQSQILASVSLLPNRTPADLHNLLIKKAGGSLGALNVLAAGPYRSPPTPLNT